MKTEKNEPREYDFSKKAEIKRWFAEMEGYLKNCGICGTTRQDNFVIHGTDREGRKFALEGFFKLKEMMLKQPIFTPEEIELLKDAIRNPLRIILIESVKNKRAELLKKLKEVGEKWTG